MSAVAIINTETLVIEIKATLVFYGKYAEPFLAQKIVEEINTMWNEPATEYQLSGKKYKPVFNINYECLGNNNIINRCASNKDFAINFIRIEDKNTSERSMMGFGLGQNSGHWLITDQLGDSTTAAHEFGHALGLPHPNQMDYRNTGSPPIMAPRGTIVDSEFQWNPMAEVGAFGGTMRPIFRKVRYTEVLEILDNISLIAGKINNIGSLSNVLYDEIGRPVRFLS
jgi:hypothetical protein